MRWCRSERRSRQWLIASRWTATTSASGGAAGDGDHVVGGHGDRVALHEARAAGVDHDHVGPVGVERGLDLVAVDRVARDVEHGLAGRAQHEARDRGEHVGRSRPCRGGRPCGRSRRPRGRARPPTGRTSVKPRSRSAPSSGGWQSSGMRLVEQIDRGFVEVVGVQVGDEHGVEARRRPPRQARAARRAGCARSLAVFGTGSRAPAGSSIGSTRSRRPASSDEQRRMADQPKRASTEDSAPNLHKTPHRSHARLAHSAP